MEMCSIHPVGACSLPWSHASEAEALSSSKGKVNETGCPRDMWKNRCRNKFTLQILDSSCITHFQYIKLLF